MSSLDYLKVADTFQAVCCVPVSAPGTFQNYSPITFTKTFSQHSFVTNSVYAVPLKNRVPTLAARFFPLLKGGPELD